MDHPLIAVEDPPDFPTHPRSNRYRVLDSTRNRVVGTVFGEQVGHPLERWVWAITLPAARGTDLLSPRGTAKDREGALADLKAAWLTYQGEANWPPPFSVSWSQGYEGQGVFRPGEEPRGWERSG